MSPNTNRGDPHTISTMFKRWTAEKKAEKSDNKPPSKQEPTLKQQAEHIETTTDHQMSDDSSEEEISSQSAFPFGDGSDKVFGMENFGNTCYCNSVLQCLFYTTSFRNEIINFPHTEPRRKRRTKVSGNRQHPFASATRTTPPTSSAPSSVAKPKRASIFSMKKEPSMSPSVVSLTSTQPQQTKEVNGTAPSFNSPMERKLAAKHPELKELGVSYVLNAQKNISVVGTSADPNSTAEQRKKNALVKGPIVNLDHLYNKNYNVEKSLFSAIKDCFECMAESRSKTGVVSPSRFISILKENNELFRNSMHQDAHEFLNFLINNILEVTQSLTHSDIGTQMSTILEGLLTSETKCLACENVTFRDEKFLDLSIDLLPNSSVTNCLKTFSESEMLNESNKFYCDNCHSLQEAAKSMKLRHLPKVLALHLKRFKYVESLNRNTKLFHRVSYPKTLRIFNTTADTPETDTLYELYAVVVHIGGGPYHGHYVSVIKTERYGWLLFDDEAVECVDENYVYRFFGDGPGLATAYVLFYQEISEQQHQERDLFDGMADDESMKLTDSELSVLMESTELNEQPPPPATPKSCKVKPESKLDGETDNKKKNKRVFSLRLKREKE